MGAKPSAGREHPHMLYWHRTAFASLIATDRVAFPTFIGGTDAILSVAV